MNKSLSMKKMYVFFVLFSTVNTFSQNFENDLKQLEVKNQKCLDRGENMYKCSQKFYKQSDSLLNVVYRHARKKMTVSEKVNLKNEQLKWLRLRDKKFKEINSSVEYQGLDNQMIQYQEKAEIVNKRTFYLISNFVENKKTTFSKTEFYKIIPENYTILDSIKGDLNRDDFDDYVVVLSRNDEIKTSDCIGDKVFRPLILLLGNKEGRFIKVAENKTTVLCYDCGGLLGDPYEGVTIKEGCFSVEHYGGSNSRWTKIITYKYSEKSKRWFLYKKVERSYNMVDVDDAEESIETQEDFGIVKFIDFNIYEE